MEKGGGGGEGGGTDPNYMKHMCVVNTRVTKSYQINQWAILVKGGGGE